MNILSMGRPFGTPGEPITHFQSERGHEIRTLAIDGPADYRYSAADLAPEILARINLEWPVDLWLCWCPEVMPPPWHIEHADVRTVAIVSDWTVYFPQLEHNLSRFDLVVTDALGAESMRIPNVAPRYFGPIYSHRTGVHRNLDLDRDIDIAFAGNLNHAVHARRGSLLEKVAALSDRYKVVIASELDDDAYTELLNRSRIVFNAGLRREMNLRCFETLACGALLFIEEENREVRDLLNVERECVLYREENLVPLLEHYLDHPHELNHRAEHGHARAESLAGESRLDELIESWAAAAGQFRSFQDLPPQERALADAMFYASAPDQGHRDEAHITLQRAAVNYPDDVEIQTAHAVSALEALATLEESERKAGLPKVLEQLKYCAEGCPDAAPVWMNLAKVARSAGATEAERRFLELALEAEDTTCGEQLVGDRNDPYYARWREALAFGNARVSLLHAAASVRLAALAAVRGEKDLARELAAQSEDLSPGIAAPYRVVASVSDAEFAAEALEEGLRFTALDADHRLALIESLVACGRERDAEKVARESYDIFSAWTAATVATGHFYDWLTRLSSPK